MEIKYNVYYSGSSNGPWIKSNTSLIDNNLLGNQYTITGLEQDVIYYIMVVGGVIDDRGVWIPLSGQPIGPNATPIKDLANPNIISAKTHSVQINSTSTLTMSFGVI